MMTAAHSAAVFYRLSGISDYTNSKGKEVEFNLETIEVCLQPLQKQVRSKESKPLSQVHRLFVFIQAQLQFRCTYVLSTLRINTDQVQMYYNTTG